jgi:hypothetical protein
MIGRLLSFTLVAEWNGAALVARMRGAGGERAHWMNGLARSATAVVLVILR